MRTRKYMLSILGRVMLLFAFPVIVIVTLGWNSNSLMVIIIYFQLLVIWMQAEVYERQNVMLLAQFEPSFRVTLGENLELIIENISQNPAYNVRLSRILYENGKPVPPEEWRKKLDWPEEPFIQCLSPGEKGVLCYFTPLGTLENYFLNKVIEVSYQTRIGQDEVIRLIPLPGDSFLVIHPRRKLPGFLHKLNEDIDLLVRYLNFSRRLKEIKNEKKS